VSADVDIVVVGGGVAGASAAALLASSGRKVALVDQRRPQAIEPEAPLAPRVVAISPGAREVLDAAGAWQRMPAQRLGPYDRMQVSSGSGEITFRASEHGLEYLGWIVEIPLMQAALWQALESSDAHPVTLLAPASVTGFAMRKRHVRIEFDDGRIVRAGLLVASDGARSRLRRLAGMETDSWHYNQRALVTHVTTEKPNRGIAWQRFTEHGPLALLPLPGGRSSVVWSQPARRVEQQHKLDDNAFLAAINAGLNSPFGQILEATQRFSFPLVRRQSRLMVHDRLVLLGDAARNIHPLAGQGLNLGLMDAAALAQLLDECRDDSDLQPALARYQRWRQGAGAGIIDGVHFINELTAPAAGRALAGAGFSLAARLWPARQLFVEQACAIDRDSPRIARRAGQ